MIYTHYPVALFLKDGDVILVPDRWSAGFVRLRSGCRHDWNPQLPSHREIAWRGCFVDLDALRRECPADPPEYGDHDRQLLGSLRRELNLTWRGESPCHVAEFLAAMALYEATARGPWRLRTHAYQKLMRGIVHAAASTPPVVAEPHPLHLAGT